MICLTLSLALETAKNGITINTIYLGYPETALTEGAIENIVQKTDWSKDNSYKQLLINNPKKRFIQPEQIVNTVFLFCQDLSSYITEQASQIAGKELII